MKTSQNIHGNYIEAVGGRGHVHVKGRQLAARRNLVALGACRPPASSRWMRSGLRGQTCVTAETLVTVLMHVNRDDRLREPFEGSLPIAGRDGTLAARMRGTAAEGNARAKSGTLANVRSLAGYMTSADGEGLVFAIVANDFGTMPEVAHFRYRCHRRQAR